MEVLRSRCSLLCCAGKEYRKGDSRYVASDTATVTVEAITAVLEGPASLLAVYVFRLALFLALYYSCSLTHTSPEQLARV
jgi:hypothetical protein